MFFRKKVEGAGEPSPHPLDDRTLDMQDEFLRAKAFESRCPECVDGITNNGRVCQRCSGTGRA